MKISNFIKKIIHFFQSEEEEDVIDTFTPENVEAVFTLYYKTLLIGTLTLRSGIWYFQYSEAFKNQSILSPIIGFPDALEIYESDELFPFFAYRIPSLQRLKIQQIIKEDESRSEVDLLKRFGQQSITNPYQLLPT